MESKLRTKVLKTLTRFFAVVIVSTVFFHTLNGQATELEEPQLRDEFGGIQVEALLARLDRFAYEIYRKETVTGLIVTHGPEGIEPGSGRALNKEFARYLVDEIGLPASSVKTIYAGRYSSPTESLTRLWLLPPGSKPPKPITYSAELEKKGLLFELLLWEFPDTELFTTLDVFGTSCPNFESLTNLAGFADLIKQQPASRAYIVGFHYAESAPRTWRRLADRYIELLESHGVSGSRISLHFGGYIENAEESSPEEAKLEVWLLAEDSPSPSPANLVEKRPEKPVSVRSDGFLLDQDVIVPKLFDILDHLPNYRISIVFEHDLTRSKFAAGDYKRILKHVEEVRSEVLKRGIQKDRIELVKETIQPRSQGDVHVSLGDVRFWLLPPGTRLPKDALTSP